MSLHTIYGINGVGKDTVGEELKARNPNTVMTSESRALMYLMGIIPDYQASQPVTRDQYKQLEDTPYDKMRELEATDYQAFIGDIGASGNTTLMLSHLVFALFLDKTVQYLDEREVPDWYVGSNDSLVHLVAPPAVILDRRQANATVRDRGDLDLSQIEHHQALCDEKWAKISGVALAEGITLATIENIDLSQAVAQAEEVIYG